MVKLLKIKKSYINRTWYGVAVAITSIAFGILFGVLAKTFSLVFSTTQKNRKIAGLHVALNQSHQKLEKHAYAIEQVLLRDNENIWGSPEFIQNVDEFMRLAENETDLFFKALEIEGKGNAETMAKILNDQYGVKGSYFVDCCDGNRFYYLDGGYCYKFFYSSLTSTYHFIRNRAYKDDQIAPFFDQESPQSKWRIIYNRSCEKLDLIRDKLEDQRFSKWSQKDDDPKQMLNTDSRPTFYWFIHLMNGSMRDVRQLIPEMEDTDKLVQLLKEDRK